LARPTSPPTGTSSGTRSTAASPIGSTCHGQPTLYRLAKITEAHKRGETIVLVEGEKDVHTLEAIGAVATTAPMGAGNFAKVDVSPLYDAEVIAIADDDEAGEQWATQVLAKLEGKARSLDFAKPRTGNDISDHIAASHTLAEIVPWHPPEPEPDASDDAITSSWLPVDLGPALEGDWQPPQPTVGQRTDGRGLFYPGKSHAIISETEAGKTWFALAACYDEINADRHVLYVDFEDDQGSIAGQLLTMGALHEKVLEFFHYIRPEEPLGNGANLAILRDVVERYHPTLAVVDGVTEAMTMHGLDPLKNVDAALFGHILTRRLAAAGCAVANLDHVTKSSDGRGRYALGAVHNLNALDGAAYVLENRTPFGVGITGRSTIKIAKDRPGQLRPHGLPSAGGLHWYGDLVIESHAEGWTEVYVEPPHEASADFRPTEMMTRVAQTLGEHGPLSQRRIVLATKGKTESIVKAIDYLVIDGFVSEKTPHELLKPYPPPEDE
jgi:5S rRNA maturation endonuclease (ribonuclease M5)